MLNQNFAILAAVIPFLGSISYFMYTLQGKVKPNKVTWFFWSLAPLIAFFAEVKEGVGVQSLMTFSVGFTPLLIFVASFVNKKSYWKIGRFDLACGILAFVGIILWQATKNGDMAIAFSILSDALAAFPTIVKSYREPETENYFAYLASVIGAGLTLLTISRWKFSDYGFPLYILLMASFIAALIRFKLGRSLQRFF